MYCHSFGMHQDVLHASLEFSTIIGAGYMVYHPGRFVAEEEFGIRGPITMTVEGRQLLLDHEAGFLQEAADSYPEVTIAMENARPYLYHSPY
jgi:hypothetical protein